MNCCASKSGEAARFFSWFARRSGVHYRKKGLGKTQRQLLDALIGAGVDGASVLDIGCGVGYLHHSLLKAGADRATGVDLSEKMLSEARALANEQALSERVDYRLGDFVLIGCDIPDADITLLDKVVCCYPDSQTLVSRSLEKTRKLYALTYPRLHLFNRIMTTLESLFLALIRCQFRPYLYDPVQVQSWIEAHGFRKRSEKTTWLWLTQVYSR